jgi:Domain of unknown function (DUF4034)
MTISGARIFGITFLLFLACTAWGLDLKNTASSPCSLDARAAIQAGDGSNDIEALASYQAAMAHLLEQEKFADLDCIADSARKEKFPGGFWKIHILYAGIDKPQLHGTEEDWQTLLVRLQRWVSARPKSITARVALAGAYLGYGWQARGDGFADTVSRTGWQLFEERLQKAKSILDEASSLPTKCPEWYLTMMLVARGQSWEKERVHDLFLKAIGFEPGYYYYYRAYAFSISPRWGGEEGESERFAQESADRLGGTQGDILYFQIASNMICRCVDDENTLKRLSWPRIQKGYSELEKQSGNSLTNMNLLLYLAIKEADAIVADKLFQQVGDNNDEKVWNRKYFEQCKKWAADAAPAAVAEKLIDDAVVSNAQTSEGNKYAAGVANKLDIVLQDCSQAVKDDSVAFYLRIRIEQNGALGGMTASAASPTLTCVYQKLAEWLFTKATPFSPPPHPAYWLQFQIDPTAKSAQLSHELPTLRQ